MELWIILGLIIVTIVAVIAIYNDLVGANNRVERAWSDVVAYQRQKTKLIPELEQMVKSYMEYEEALLSEVTRLRTSLSRLSEDHVDAGTLSEVESVTRSLFSRFNAVAEAYPNLASANLMQDLMGRLSRVEENVAAAITIFNRAVEQFNSTKESVPWNLVNATFNKYGRYTPFRDTEGEADIEYKFQPN